MAQTCPAKHFLRIHEGWTSRRRSGALGFGSCLHEGLAVWYRTGDLGKALIAINDKWPPDMPVDDFRTKEKCVSVMIQYAKQYAHESWQVVGMPDNPVVEIPFTLDSGMYLPCAECWNLADTDPYEPLCRNCNAPKEPIEYGGIYDLLVEFGGNLYVVDHKSTSMMGSGYFNQFKPNNQMTGYIWAASQMSGKKVNGAIINAIGIYKTGTTKFEREITSRSPLAIEAWKLNVYHECVQIKQHERDGFWPMRTGACTQYGLCEYHSVHSLDHPVEQQKRLETDYVRDKWDFENRD
jgi:PD-(D/E)XK nuclease superfamily protein